MCQFIPLRYDKDLLSPLCLIQYGISPETLLKNKRLSKFFKLLTTSTDDDSKVWNVLFKVYVKESFIIGINLLVDVSQAYVSTVQAYDYPVTAFQWHPEVISSLYQFSCFYFCTAFYKTSSSKISLRTEQVYGMLT